VYSGEGQAKLSSYLLHAGFLLCLFFDPEDKGDIIIRIVC
jgi:hypothetical protein